MGVHTVHCQGQCSTHSAAINLLCSECSLAHCTLYIPRMPFITLLTNLKEGSLPSDLMPRLIKTIAPIMSKPVPAFNWVLDSDKTMSQGPDNATSSFIWLKVEAIGTFQDPEVVKRITPDIFHFFAEEAKVGKEQLKITFHNLDATHVAAMGQTVAELRK